MISCTDLPPSARWAGDWRYAAPVRVIVLGPPGCDRDTIAGLVAASIGVPVIGLVGVV
jgi:hypothetical protein